jgi:hypothetical protein
LQGAIDDSGLGLEPVRCGVFEALQRLFWLTAERIGG